ncbi:50S ribosomal protein L29P [Candidatus Termititenax persephonae]|uniref:Large ribosomal subunit protein uL29 n=1 Tax=Candidatus Termititenax persephonae TaxID=2218525 RepID=A0A388TGC8_9BACT|nr:50S ribosomal protein L29P [Candidatus Termititenax persephonae]
MLTLEEIRKMDRAALEQKVAELKKEYFEKKQKLLRGEHKNIAEFRQIRRTIARLLTVAQTLPPVVRERKIETGGEKKPEEPENKKDKKEIKKVKPATQKEPRHEAKAVKEKADKEPKKETKKETEKAEKKPAKPAVKKTAKKEKRK